MAGTKNSGRKALPAEVKRLRGSLNVTREKANGQELPVARLTKVSQCKPAGLDLLTERARKIFKDTCKLLIEMRVITKGDLPNVVAYAQQYDLYLTALADLSKGSYTPVRDQSGQLVKFIRNPAFATMNASLQMMSKFGALLGLSPSDRQRLRPEGSEENKLDVLNIIMNNNYGPDEQ